MAQDTGRPPAAPVTETRHRPRFVLVSMLLLCSLVYYFGELADAAGWSSLRQGFFYTVHDVQRLFFLGPIIYAGYVFRVTGAVAVTGVSLVIFLPRAFFISPFPDPLLRVAIFTLVAGIVGALTGMTRNEFERRRRLEALVRSERDKLMGILERMEDGVVIIGPDYRIRFMNPSMVKEFGAGLGEYCHQQLYHFTQPCAETCRLGKVLAGSTEKWDYNFPDGRTYELVASPFVDSDGVTCQLAVYRNITRHKQTELELTNLSQMKTDLLSNISHELRSPLTSIKGIISSLLQENVRMNEDTQQMLLRGVSEETDRLASLVTNLLNMSKLEAGVWRPEKQRCHIADIINDAVEQQKWGHRHRVFRTEIAPGLPEFYADYGQIKQVLINLLENAAAYSEETKPIAVRAKIVDAELEVSVADQGTGIPAEDLGKIFQKFYRGSLKRQQPGGTGLGLAICQAIITGHGGRIWVESEVWRGATFYFRLPLAAPGNT